MSLKTKSNSLKEKMEEKLGVNMNDFIDEINASIKNNFLIRMNNMKNESDSDESEEMIKKVFMLIFAGFAAFIVACVFVGIFEFIPRN
ncbi:MAG TPA: hypothetical protein QGF04_00210 [Woeseiaceae bacterium]|nr:hypothetical protein [Woeseiaceae bacterium]